MWRIIWPDGRVSIAVNLARAKDAAAAIAERGPPARNRHRLRWVSDRSESLYGARTRVPRVPAYPDTPLTNFLRPRDRPQEEADPMPEVGPDRQVA
jgi:hypothetical protein